jgi:hypothetical protein
MYLQGIPAMNIMRITGHKTEQAFRKYIKVSEEESAVMLKDHWEKLFEVNPPTLKVA